MNSECGSEVSWYGWLFKTRLRLLTMENAQHHCSKSIDLLF